MSRNHRPARARPTLRQLEYLLAVADSLKFRAAAAACHVSQPALSAQIRQLEELLGVTLFERDKRRVALTPAGKLIVERARAALADVDSLVDAALGHGQPLTGPLALGAIPTVAPYVVPRLLALTRERHPGLRLVLVEATTASLMEALRTNRVEVALLALPVQGAGFSTLPLFDDPFLLAAPAGHRLASRARVKPGDLRREGVLLLEEGHCLREQALQICREAGASEVGDVRATSLTTLLQMVAGGLGITLLPAIASPDAARAEGERDGRGRGAGAGGADAAPGGTRVEGVVVRPILPAPTRTIGLVWRATSPRAPEFVMLAETLRRGLPPGAQPRE